MNIKTATTMLPIAGLGLGAAQAATTWTGATSTDWDTSTNWDNDVPDGTQAAIIGDNATVARTGRFDDGAAGDNKSQFTSLTIASTSTLSYTSGGDFRGETWNVDGTITMGEVSGFQADGTTFNFGPAGSIAVASDMWGNNHNVNLNAVIDLKSAVEGTLVTHDLLSWTGYERNSPPTMTITDTFTVLNGTGTQIADGTDPSNPGEYSFFYNTGFGGSLSVKYMTVPEPSSTALLGLLVSFGLFLRRRK